MALEGVTATVTQATAPVIVFQADFEGAEETDATDGNLTAANLNADTSTGM